MASFNRVVLIGNLTRDPDYRQLSSGQALCRLGLAINRQFKNKQTGTVTQEVCFIDVEVWGAQAESCRQYLQKGRPVLVEGRLKLDSWEDGQGQSRSKHVVVAERIVFLGASNSTETTAADAEESAPTAPANPLEKELLDQIDSIKKRQHSKAAGTVTPAKKAAGHKKQEGDAATSGDEELNFKDEPPFNDELPF